MLRIEHNRALPKPGQSLRKLRLVAWRWRALRVRVMVGYVWRPGPSAAVPTTFAPLTAAWRARAARQHGMFSQALRARWRNKPPPAHVVRAGRLALRCSFPPVPAAVPVRPQGGSPKFKGNPVAVSPAPTLWRRLAMTDFAPVGMRCKGSPRLAAQAPSVFPSRPSRPSPAGAARPGRSHRRRQASPFSRCALRLSKIPLASRAPVRRNSRLRKKPDSLGESSSFPARKPAWRLEKVASTTINSCRGELFTAMSGGIRSAELIRAD